MTVAYAMVVLLILGVAAFGIAALVLLLNLLRAAPVPVPVQVRSGAEPRPTEPGSADVPFEIPPGLDPQLMGIAWLIGRWEGAGKGTYPGTEDFEFGQQIDFAQNGGNYLHYLSQTFEMGPDGKAIRPLSMETGFWRPQLDGSIEVVMCHPSGYAEVWYGKITGAKIELATDAVVRTVSADDYSAGQRLYGNVEGDLLWTLDKAALGQPLQTNLWARLKRT